SAKAVLVMEAAGRWFQEESRTSRVSLIDIDDDGEKECVVATPFLYAVIAPTHGGRLIWLFARTRRGVSLLVGNPTDDWNFQTDPNAYMQIPPNHPGAF